MVGVPQRDTTQLDRAPEGAEMRFPVSGKDIELEIFTTRADTIFGVTFMVLAPESAYVAQLTSPEQKDAVDAYLNEVKHKTERERQIDKKVSGVFTGSYAINPLTGKEIPVWISDYVLAGYGTGQSWQFLHTIPAITRSHAISHCPLFH